MAGLWVSASESVRNRRPAKWLVTTKLMEHVISIQALISYRMTTSTQAYVPMLVSNSGPLLSERRRSATQNQRLRRQQDPLCCPNQPQQLLKHHLKYE